MTTHPVDIIQRLRNLQSELAYMPNRRQAVLDDAISEIKDLRDKVDEMEKARTER